MLDQVLAPMPTYALESRRGELLLALRRLTQAPVILAGPLPHHPEYYELVRQMVELCERKRADYSPDGDPLGNMRRSAGVGVPPWRGVLTRAGEKWTRVEGLTGAGADAGRAVRDETIEDTLLDLSNLALLAIVARRTLADDGADL